MPRNHFETTRTSVLLALAFILLPLAFNPALDAQEKPYFVTYSQDLEEPGNLEIETKTALSRPAESNHYGAMTAELEYGVQAWWTTELYLDGQTTAGDSTIFTGFRLENRFRPLMREYVVNPVLYVEYESISGPTRVSSKSSATMASPIWPAPTLRHARSTSTKAN